MVLLKPEYFTAEGIPATVYNLGLIRQYGGQFYNWEPYTLWLEIQDDYGVEPSEEVKDKIQALTAINVINTVYTDCSVFRSVALALNDNDPQFDISGGLDVHEVAWAIDEIRRNANYSHPWGNEVKNFIIICLKFEEFLKVPEAISDFVDLDYKPEVSPDILKIPEVQKQAAIRYKRVAAYVLHKREELNKYLASSG